MNLPLLRTFSRKYTKTTETGYPDVTLDIDINNSNAEIHMMIRECEDNSNLDGDFKVYDLVTSVGKTSGQVGYNGEFPLPSSSTDLKEVYLDYGNGAGLTKAEVISIKDSEVFEDTGAYTESKPAVFIYRDSYFVRPLATTTVTDGIKLITQKRAETLSGVMSPSWEPSFHQLLPLKVALDYFMLYPEKYNPQIEKKANQLEAQLISLYQSRSPIEKKFRTIKEQF